jgi:hypothetical protein
VDFVILGNDDAIRRSRFVTRLIDALVEGKQEGRESIVTRATGTEIEPEPEPVPAPAPVAVDPSGESSQLAAAPAEVAPAAEATAGGDESPAAPASPSEGADQADISSVTPGADASAASDVAGDTNQKEES